MTPRTLRRKLQKKAKHRPCGRCPECGRRTERRVRDVWGDEVEPGGRPVPVPALVEKCGGSWPGCGWQRVLR